MKSRSVVTSREQFVIVHGRFSGFGQPVKETHDEKEE
jgi:hypothetical protein